MAEDAKRPTLRFAGFTDDWEQRELGELVDVSTGRLDANAMVEDGEYDFYTSGIKKYRIDTPAFDGPAITIAGNGATVGYMHLADGKFNAYQRTYVLECFQADRQFLYSEIGNRLPQKIAEEARTGNIPYIVMDMLTDLIISLPASKDEQATIGGYFKSFDNLITLHQRKLDKLLTVKKSMLEKMFPKNGANVPEIRFTGFTDDWEQRKFSETFIYLRNNSLSRADLNYNEGLVKNVHYGDVLIKFAEILDVEKAEIPFISNNEFTVSNTSLLQNGDVIIADAAEDETVGKCSEIKGIENLCVVSGLHTIPCRPNKTFASGYLGYYLNSSAYHDQLLPLIQGTKISSISKSALKNTDIIYPDSEREQQQIGRFFQSLDNLINLHQRKLEKIKNIKKSCLEKMFV